MKGRQGRVLSELQGVLDLSKNRVRSRRKQEKMVADGHGGGFHIAGEPVGAGKNLPLDQWALANHHKVWSTGLVRSTWQEI